MRKQSKFDDLTKEELISELIRFYDENNTIPKTTDMKIMNGFPPIRVYRNMFGNFKNALIEAKLYDFLDDKYKKKLETHRYTDEQLLKILDEYIKENKKIPTDAEFERDKTLPSKNAYYLRFGGWNNAIKLLGYDKNKIKLEQKKSKMKEKFIDLYYLLGRTPTSRDLDYYSKNKDEYYSCKAYLNMFGSVYNTQIECGLDPTIIGRNKTKENMIDDLIELKDILGRTPMARDLINFPHVCCSRRYIDVFGSWNKAIENAGLDLTVKFLYTTNGTECLSSYELDITQWLEDNSILFEKEINYKEYIPDFNKYYRFDWVISYKNKKYFIEMFGIEGNDNYDNKTDEKINLCKENNLELISIFPEDLKNKTIEEIFYFIDIEDDKMAS